MELKTMKQFNKTVFFGFDYDHFSGKQEDKMFSMCPERFFMETLVPHDEIRDINALVVQYNTKIDHGTIDYFPNLEYIGVFATMTENIEAYLSETPINKVN